MPQKILVGPLLGVEANDLYTVCFLSPTDIKSIPELTFGNSTAKFIQIAETPTGIFWRAEMNIIPGNKAVVVKYAITIDGSNLADGHNRSDWNFYVPASNETPRMAYASCNGFSDPKLYKRTNEPYKLWDDMLEEHQSQPFSVLLMGGDQLYADGIWAEVKYLVKWRELKYETRIEQTPPKTFIRDVEKFYDHIYQTYWSQKTMSYMMASVPSIMMWDDHDIFDGWGSYPDDLQKSDVFKDIFKVAKKYFELFQIRSHHNKSLIGFGNNHYSLGLKFREYLILSIDTRTHRTRTQILTSEQWKDIQGWINSHPKNLLKGKGSLLLMISIPVVYKRFGAMESVMLATPWLEEPEDDLLDQWSSSYHEGEQIRLVHNIDEYGQHLGASQMIILSGDVHVGGVGQIVNQKTGVKIYQVISSAIAHPAPTTIEWLGLSAISNDQPIVFGDYKLEMIKAHQTSRKYIVDRNYSMIKREPDGKIWVNWKCDTWKEKPLWVIA